MAQPEGGGRRESGANVLMEYEFSEDQQRAHDAIIQWFFNNDGQLLTLGGYAGTGKTTLIAAVAESMRREVPQLKIAFACFTGKASLILKNKLIRLDVLGDDYCGTIHGLIYKPVFNDKGKIVSWERVEGHKFEAGLIIVDEASMVDEVIFADLRSYGRPILAVGDHGQLPPVTGNFNLMHKPDLRLERIHRQDAGNPIIRASMLVREHGKLPLCNWENKVLKHPAGTSVLQNMPLDELRATLVLCGTNKMRVGLNAKIRAKLGYLNPEPQVGESVICLRNDRNLGIFNGLTGVINEIEPDGQHRYRAKISFPGNLEVACRINKLQFGRSSTLQGEEIPGLHRNFYGNLFDWGYAMTVHKSQGSEAQQVVVFEDCDWIKEEDVRRRWLYTAYTRASERLIVVANK